MAKQAISSQARTVEQLAAFERALDDAEASPGEIVERPDGYHWIAPDGRQEFGPFETLELAEAARDTSDDNAAAPAELLREVEGEFGVADWIDPATGEPAEGPCPPHLEED